VIAVNTFIDASLHARVRTVGLDEVRWTRGFGAERFEVCCQQMIPHLWSVMEGTNYSHYYAIYVNLYGSSTLETTLLGGAMVKVTQETEYPWNGHIRLTVNECGDAPFALKLRIPGWAKSATVRLNSECTDDTPTPGTYLELRRVWQPGDEVTLDVPMPPQLMEAHPLVEETLNQVAVKRGPLVYCMESLDLPPDLRLWDVTMPANIDLTARYDPHLLGGVVVLEGEALARSVQEWKSQLYREFQATTAKRINVRFVPYFAWGNRGQCEMTVWLPLAAINLKGKT
jgi:hypothetical protein